MAYASVGCADVSDVPTRLPDSSVPTFYSGMDSLLNTYATYSV